MDLYSVRNELQKGKTIYDIKLRVTYYARVSTDKDEQVHSLKNQIDYYSDYIKQNKNWQYVEGYIDEGLSGTSVDKRDSFLRMINDARRGMFDYIITKEISRFSRSTLDSIKYTQELLRNGVGVLFQSDNINTLHPDSELRLTIMSSIAQDEVRKLSERIKFGFKRAINSGVVLGNSKIWGYKKANGKLYVDEEQAKVVRLIFEMYATQNIGMRTICNELENLGYVNTNGSKFSFSTIKNILVNPKYKGYYCGNKTQKYDYRSSERKNFDQDEWIMYKDEETVPAIVSEELWDKANRVLAKRSELMKSDNPKGYTNKYPYSGKIICTAHQCTFQRSAYKYPSGDKEIWLCKEYRQKGKAACSIPIIYTSELDIIMKQCYNELVTNKADIIHNLVKMYSTISQKTSIKDDIAKNKNQINENIKRKDKLLDLSISGKISDDEFEKRNVVFNEEIETMKAKIAELEKQDRQNSSIEESIEALRKVIAKELDFESGFDNAIIDNLLDKIEVSKTDNTSVIDVKIHLKMMGQNLETRINRDKNNTSACYTSYI